MLTIQFVWGGLIYNNILFVFICEDVLSWGYGCKINEIELSAANILTIELCMSPPLPGNFVQGLLSHHSPRIPTSDTLSLAALRCSQLAWFDPSRPALAISQPLPTPSHCLLVRWNNLEHVYSNHRW